MKAFDLAWRVLKYNPLTSRDTEEAGKADLYHALRAEAQRPNDRAIRTIADPSQYRFLGGGMAVDVGGPATNPFPGGMPTVQEDMAEIEMDERTQHLIDNFVPQPAETKPPAPTGSNPVQPPKSDMSPQGSFPTSMGPTRQQKRGKMGRGVAVKRPGFRSGEAMPLPESAKDRERKLTFSRRL